MTTRARLILLLACLVTVFTVASWGLKLSHRHEAENIRQAVRQQRSTFLERVIVLTGQSLQSFAADYSLWDDMVGFLRTGDPGWARVNIDPSMANFGAQAAWVLRLDGSIHYQAGSLDAATLATLPFARPEFLTDLARDKTLHFYVNTPAGLLELRTAPIQPSSDIARTSPPLGWWIVGRLWNEAHLQNLRDVLQSELSFDPLPDRPDDPAEIRLSREMRDWRGQPARTLHLAGQSTSLSRLLEGNEDETFVLLGFGLITIAVTAAGLSRWILVPLHRLGLSLESGRTEPLQELSRKSGEFGHLARLVEQSFSQRAALEHEIRERNRIAAELRETSDRLGESLELRGRLARDLHDGVIQSIYAAGLGLEGARDLLRSDPAAAEQRLQASLRALNETIRDVRGFINSLESEAASPRPFPQTLATLVATMRSIQPGNITMEIDEALSRRIGPAQELHLLQILREAIGNALRHAGPDVIRIFLRPGTEREAELVVVDDGRGFDPEAAAGRGRGLGNLGIRAREMGGILRIDSIPGRGTRLTLHFNPTYPP